MSGPIHHLSRCPGLSAPVRQLSGVEALSCLELIHRSLDCGDAGQLAGLLQDVGALIGAEYCAALLAPGTAPRMGGSFVILDGTFPREWLQLYQASAFHRIDPIVVEHFQTFALESWSETYRRRPPTRHFVSHAEDFGLKAGFSGGYRNGTGSGGSLFSFSGPKVGQHPRDAAILECVLPHLHRVLCQLGDSGTLHLPSTPLSPRELEVLKWTGVGKSSWEVGMILRISARTVNFHVNNALRKLDAVNRTQAVAIALKMGWIELP